MLLQRLRPGELAGAAVAGAAVVLLAFADGGFFREAWTPATVGLGAVAGLAAVLRGRVRVGHTQLLVLAALAALAGWAATSALWSPDAAASLDEARRTLVYAAAVLAAVLVGGAVAAGTVAGIAVVCGYALAQRVLAGPPVPPDPFEGTLLHEPLGYANALGALAAVGLCLAVALVWERRAQIAGGALGAVLVATLVLTESRGAWLAATVGVALALALASGRLRLARGVAAAAGILLAALLAAPALVRPDALAPEAGDRVWYWNVAWHEASGAPLHGQGAGSFHLAWLERRPVQVEVRDAHSLYLETLAELGAVGLVLLLLALAPPLVAALRRPGTATAAAAAGGYAAFLFHAGIDWDWEMPAVTVAGLLCGAALLASRPARRAGAQDFRIRGIMEEETRTQEPR